MYFMGSYVLLVLISVPVQTDLIFVSLPIWVSYPTEQIVQILADDSLDVQAAIDDTSASNVHIHRLWRHWRCPVWGDSPDGESCGVGQKVVRQSVHIVVVLCIRAWRAATTGGPGSTALYQCVCGGIVHRDGAGLVYGARSVDLHQGARTTARHLKQGTTCSEIPFVVGRSVNVGPSRCRRVVLQSARYCEEWVGIPNGMCGLGKDGEDTVVVDNAVDLANKGEALDSVEAGLRGGGDSFPGQVGEGTGGGVGLGESDGCSGARPRGGEGVEGVAVGGDTGGAEYEAHEKEGGKEGRRNEGGEET